MLGKEEIVSQIAKEFFIREEVVNDILNRFVDIAVEEIVNYGEFRIHRLLSVSTAEYKGYKNRHGVVPPHRRLKVKLSSGINKLFKMRESDVTIQIDRDNWSSILSRANTLLKLKSAKYKPKTIDEIKNPFLEEDDDPYG